MPTRRVWRRGARWNVGSTGVTLSVQAMARARRHRARGVDARPGRWCDDLNWGRFSSPVVGWGWLVHRSGDLFGSGRRWLPSVVGMSTTIRTESRAHPDRPVLHRVHQVLDASGRGAGVVDDPGRATRRPGRPDPRRGPAGRLRFRVLAAADRNDIAAESAATSTGAWFAHHTRQTRGTAHAQVKLALALDTGSPRTRDALAPGRSTGAGGESSSGRSTRSPPRWRPRTETAPRRIWAPAAEFDHQALKVLGRRIFEAIDPEAADLAEGCRLEAEEAAAARATYLQLSANPDGATPAGSRSRPCTRRCSPRCCTPSPTPANTSTVSDRAQPHP